MKKLLLTAPILFFLFLVNADNALACSCRPNWNKKKLQQTINGAFIGSASVFSGEVIEIKPLPIQRNIIVVKFKLENIWKGKSSKEILIRTADDSAACGYDRFIVGKKYLVYTFGKADDLETDICTRTNLLENNKDLKYLDKVKILWESKKPIKL